MVTLVTKADLAKFKHVADSVKNNASWEQFVHEAQMMDVKPWLGDALLVELLAQAATVPPTFTPANTLLLEGGQYTYQNKTYLFQGLKACIIYYAFGRFTSRTPYNYTAAGVTVKETEFSSPASDKAVQRLATEALLTGASYKEDVQLYLRRKQTDYPLFKCSTRTGRPRTFFVLGD
jgi:hypothetical protein